MFRKKHIEWTKFKVMIVVGIFGISGMIGSGVNGIASFRNNRVDLYETNYRDISKFDLIDTRFELSAGCFFIEESDRENIFYYAIPVYSDDRAYWIGLEIPEADYGQMEAVVEQTIALLNEEEYTYCYLEKVGRLKRLSFERYDYLTAFISSIENKSEYEVEDYVLPVYITTFNPKIEKYVFVLFVIMMIIGVLGVAGDIYDSKVNHFKRGRKGENATIFIFDKEYLKSYFDNVNMLVEQNKEKDATRELRKLTGIGAEDAEYIISNWNKIYR